jgi:hypothetical protein
MSADSEPVKVTEPIHVGGEKKANDGKRVKVLLAAAGGVLVVGLLASRLLGGGGGTETTSADLPTGTSGSAASSTTSTTAPPTTGDYRDPFSAPAGLAVAAPVTVTVTGTVTPPTTQPVPTDILPAATTPASSTTPTTLPAAGTTPANTGGGRVRVTLLEVDAGPKANVRVDDQVVNSLAPNESFLGSYRVVSLDAGSHCGVILYGDERLALCEGDEAVV